METTFHHSDPEIFRWRDVAIQQNFGVHRISTDALLLGGWIPSVVPSATSVLDAGTGNGILALMASTHFPQALITACDVDATSVALAQRNFAANRKQDRMHAILADIHDVRNELKGSFDLIVSNPPFYLEDIKPSSEFRNRTMHISASAPDWLASLIPLVCPGGHICIIIPFERAAQWIITANSNQWFCNCRMDVYSRSSDHTPVRSLIHFSDRLSSPRLERLEIRNAKNEYTTAYLKMTGIQTSVSKGYPLIQDEASYSNLIQE